MEKIEIILENDLNLARDKLEEARMHYEDRSYGQTMDALADIYSILEKYAKPKDQAQKLRKLINQENKKEGGSGLLG